jgi:hypothetical protein
MRSRGAAPPSSSPWGWSHAAAPSRQLYCRRPGRSQKLSHQSVSFYSLAHFSIVLWGTFVMPPA